MQDPSDKALQFFRITTEPVSGRRFFAVVWARVPGLHDPHVAGEVLVIEERSPNWFRWSVSAPRLDPEEQGALLQEVIRDVVEEEYLDAGCGAALALASPEEFARLVCRGSGREALLAIINDVDAPSELENLAHVLVGNDRVSIRNRRSHGPKEKTSP